MNINFISLRKLFYAIIIYNLGVALETALIVSIIYLSVRGEL